MADHTADTREIAGWTRRLSLSALSLRPLLRLRCGWVGDKILPALTRGRLHLLGSFERVAEDFQRIRDMPCLLPMLSISIVERYSAIVN